MLLESFIRVILVEEAAGMMIHDWSSLLSAWNISYICGMLNVGIDALDTCEDGGARIGKRISGGTRAEEGDQ